MAVDQPRSPLLSPGPGVCDLSNKREGFRARLENALPYGRTLSPSWERGEAEAERKQCSDSALTSTRNDCRIPTFTFKHEGRPLKSTSDKRASQRKMANLEKFLTSVKKSAQLSQFDNLPFHNLSTSKRYGGFLRDVDKFEDESLTFFQKEFEIIERIGFGDFAEVFKVRWRRDDNVYALKRSIQRFGSCFGNEQPLHDQLRWMDEVFYHSAVSNHANIVECVQSWEEAGYFHIQMEFMPQRLDAFTAKNYPLPEHSLWNIFTDILMAVDHVHKSGYCHFDIKPENIFLNEFGITKLGDFSLITTPEADHYESGDSRYMPLEALDSKNPGFGVDIFSLGMTMLELCTDIRLAGHGREWRALRESPLPTEIEARVPIAMQHILRQMMCAEPRLRPSAASLLRLHPLNIHVLRRKTFFLGLPLFRIQNAVADFLKAGISRGLQLIKTMIPSGQSLPDRPVTPPANMNFAEHTLRHHFSAGVVKTKSPPVAIPFGILDAMEEDSMGKTVSADDVCLPDDDQELPSVSFLETIQDEMESEMEENLGNSSLLEDEMGMTEEEEEDEFSSEMSPRPHWQEEEQQPDSDELNHVQVLAFSDESDGEFV